VRRAPARAALVMAMAFVAWPSAAAAGAVPPPNDDFDSRTTIPSVPYTNSTDTTEATTQPGEDQPSCAPNGKTVWFQFTPGSAMTLQADTIGSDFDTVVAVWTGPALGSLTEVACDDDAGPGVQSLTVFQANAGTNYLFQVGGFGDDFGSLTFNLGPPTTGSISGAVTVQGSGSPLAGICVDVVDVASGDFVSFSITDASGMYAAGGLPTGSYKVLFSDWCDDSHDYLSEWYDDKTSEATADPVAVTAPNTTTGINAALSLGGAISGTVTVQATGASLPFICVDLYSVSEADYVDFTETNTSGQYRFAGLESGQYKVFFYDDCDAVENYPSEWYNDKPSLVTADVVTVTAPNTTSGINAALGPPAPAPPPLPKSVALRAKPKKVEQGRKAKLTAVVAPCAGHEGDLVEFYRGSKKIASKASDGTCTAKLAVKMKKTAKFKAVSPQQDADHLAGTSNNVKVKVT
jgi:hypothetical protein